MLNYVWLVLAFPILGVIINAFFGRRLGERGVSIVGPAVVGLSFLTSLGVFFSFLSLHEGERFFEQVLYTWIPAGDFVVQAALQVDPLSTIMILVVTGVGFLIHVYAVGYMHGDPRFPRFFTYLNLFIASMLILVLANNFLMLFVGWELVGLCSYLLIGFWFRRDSAANAGKKAFITTRVGDAGFALGVFLIFTTFGTLHYSQVFEEAERVFQVGGPTVTAITLLLFAGAVGKSAQLPLHVWLPDAMEGPTPVSALIHAATMVTAGIYMVARTHVLYEMAPLSGTVVALVGALTALFAATIGLAQFDIKRVLAYSTISQLGFMMAAVGLGGIVAGMFHLASHAFFKALLFLGAGSVMHGCHGELDMRKMGGLRRHMPWTFITYVIAAGALAGVPPLAGFWSKDEILADAFAQNLVIYLLLAVAAFFTAFYISRQVFMVFYGEQRDHSYHPHESPPVMIVPLMVLAVFAAVFGFVNFPGYHWFGEFMEAHVGEFNPTVALLSTALALLGIALAWWVYGREPMKAGQPDPLRGMLGRVFTVLENKYYVDELYGFLFIQPFIRLAHFLNTVLDAVFIHDFFFVRPFVNGATWLANPFDLGVIDSIVNGIGTVVERASSSLRRVQTGYVRNYALSVLFGVVVVVAYFMIR